MLQRKISKILNGDNVFTQSQNFIDHDSPPELLMTDLNILLLRCSKKH